MASKKHFGQETEFSEDVKKMVSQGEGELWIDLQRRRLVAQQYLTYIGEAKEWIEACINEDLPAITQMDDKLRNGVYLAKLARFFAPDIAKKIFDEKQELPLSLRHSDNFNVFIAAQLKTGLPKIFYFELTDLYDKKNIPKVIYNIHALSHYLAKLGIAPKMKKKKFTFTDEELAAASEYLGDMVLPSFGDIAAQLDKETGTKQDEITKMQQEYEELASNLSHWIEENTANMNSREFLNFKAKEIQAIIDSLEEFDKGEKAQQHENLKATIEKYQSIDEKSKSLSRPPFQPDEWLEVSKLESSWKGLEDAESKKKEALQHRLELAELEEKAKHLKNWLADQASFFSRRNLQASNAEDISSLEGGLNSFRENEKKKKRSEIDELDAALNSFQKKCDGDNLAHFGADARKHREDLQKGWGILEESEKIRERSIAFNADIYKRKEKYLQDAGKFNDWAKAKVEELRKKDFLGKNSGELKSLMEELEKFKNTEKKAKAGELEEAKAAFRKINADLTAEEYQEFEPKDGFTVEDMQTNWEQLELAEKTREDDLRMKHELTLLQEAYGTRSKELVEWIKNMIELRSKRDFPKTSDECAKLAQEEETFKKTEKAKKGETKEELVVEFSTIQSKIKKESHEEYKIGEEQTPSGIASLWAQLEKAESERARDLASEQVRLGGQERFQLLKDNEAFWIKIQAIARGNEVRRKLRELMEYYKNNTGDIIKIQALHRGNVAGFHYRALQKDNPPVQTIQRFLHLLDESDRDFEEELELEKLKQQVVTQIRDNNEREKILNILDIKIALLIKNRTTLDDVVESSKKFLKKQQKKEAEGHHDISLKSLDKEARQKLESYQHLFYLLQTEPQYMARLIFQLKKKDKVSKFIETIVLTLFGYAQNAREEFLLLKLIKDAIALEMEQVTEVQDIVRGNPVFIKLVVQYTRGAKEREFLRDLLQPLIKDVIEQRDLDLDVDPLSIYRNIIKEEESRTGEKSTLAYDVSRSQALENDKVMKVFVKRLKDLRAVTDKFLGAIIASLNKLPYGLRYIANQMKASLEARFPGDEERVLKIVGNLIYYRYMNPAVVAPEGFDVIEGQISPTQRKNLAEISKMLQQISVNKLFEDEFFYLSALNDYITKAKNKFFKFFNDCCNVASPEDYFRIDKYDDFSKLSKPVVYISQEEIYSTHALILEDLDEIAPAKDDPLRVILKDLGNPPEGAGEVTVRGAEMGLTLVNRFTNVETEDSALKTLFVQTKRYVITILRIQNGENLLEILEKESNEQSEKAFTERQKKEADRAKEREAKGVISDPALNISGMSYPEIKKKTLSNLAELEKKGAVSKSNNYQEMLNAIARDIRNKNRRRIQRKQELEKVKATLANLDEKTKYLEAQKDSYNDYVNSCVNAMKDNKSTKKGKKNRPLPFTRQYFHERELKSQGKQYEFGSFKYTADQLFEKGVLVDLQGVPASQRSKVTITVSSAEVGVFEIEGKFMGMNVSSEEIRLEDLLQKQFDNVQVMTLFGVAKVNVNLMIFLINKKFYK